MLTPQEISEKGFVKAVFGGYDMAGVDDFLEAVSADYNALYKENAILKGKLKVLVEKVEEYRSTEDAMRMALLTAQRMGEEITVEANRTKDEMLQKAEDEIKSKYSDTAKRVSDEEMRLAVAAKETAKFIELSQAIMRKHSEFLEKLEAARRAVKPKGDPAKAGAPQGSARQPRAAKAAAPEGAPQPQAPPQPQPAQPTQHIQPTQQFQPVQPTQQFQPVQQVQQAQPAQYAQQPQYAPAQEVPIDNIAEQIGSVVENMTVDGAGLMHSGEMQPPMPAHEPPSSLFEDDEPIKLYTPDDETPEETSPRPKFDFDDLKFGANFDSDD